MAVNMPTLPLRADVLLSNALFGELDNGISEEFLKHYTGNDKLEEVDFLELQVDALSGAQGVEDVGRFLPNLIQLRLNNSIMPALRDLGTALLNLRVLWICRSGVEDLGGITALPSVEELYVSFNDIKDLHPLATHEALQVIDLEGNLVEDFEEVQALQAVFTLRELNLHLNPLEKHEHFSRDSVFKILPHLEMLDDIPLGIQAMDAQGSGEYDGDDGLELAHIASDDEDECIEVQPPLADEFAARDEECRALRELRQRAGQLHSGSTSASPSAQLSKSLVTQDYKKEAWSANLCMSATEKYSAFAGCGDAASLALRSPANAGTRGLDSVAEWRAEWEWRRAASAKKEAVVQERPAAVEPSEQDLVVEGLKRAPKPVPHFWPTARGAESGRRPFTGLYRTRTAWSSTDASSTVYRTSTASSVTSSSMSNGWSAVAHDPDSASSDLTAGGDGTALAGNPLAAVRRRRQQCAAKQGEDELNIRSLLRHYEASAQAGPSAHALPHESIGRLATPDVRIRNLPSRHNTDARLVGTPARAAARRSEGFEFAATTPTYHTTAGEVLVIE